MLEPPSLKVRAWAEDRGRSKPEHIQPLTRQAKATEFGVPGYTITNFLFRPNLRQDKPRNYVAKVHPKERLRLFLGKF